MTEAASAGMTEAASAGMTEAASAGMTEAVGAGMTERGRRYLAAVRTKLVPATPAPHSRTAMKEEAVRGSVQNSARYPRQARV